MHTFRDKDGTEWQISLNLSIALSIEGFDFAEALEEESPYHIRFLDSDDKNFETYLTNSRVCFTIVWLCCQQQAEKRGFTTMLQFAEVFDGKSWDNARMALMEELPDFFPQRATTLRALIKKYSQVVAAQDKMMGEAIETNITEENLQKLGDRARKEMKEEMDKIFGP